jgi:hypothetical protein
MSSLAQNLARPEGFGRAGTTTCDLVSSPERDLTAQVKRGEATRSTGQQPDRRVVVLPHDLWR